MLLDPFSEGFLLLSRPNFVAPYTHFTRSQIQQVVLKLGLMPARSSRLKPGTGRPSHASERINAFILHRIYLKPQLKPSG